jgi:hypothetical protein
MHPQHRQPIAQESARLIDFRQLILAMLVVFLPAWLITRRLDDWLVRWICLTVAVDAFDPQLIVNLPAPRVAGLLLLPSSIAALSAVWKSRAGKAMCSYLIWLGIVGLIFGYLMPWPLQGYDRLVTQTPQVRAMVYFVRRISDFSLMIFLARYLWKTRHPERLIRWFVSGTSVAAAGGILQWLTGIDLYAAITGAQSLGLEFRMRGLNYEPRGLGLAVGHGLLFSLALFARQRSWGRLAIVLMHALALFVSVSTSGLFVIAAGLITLVIMDPRTRKVFTVSAVGILVLWCATVCLFPQNGFLDSWSENVQQRMTSEKAGDVPVNKVEELALHLDIFDAAVFVMFVSRPALLVTGVGPGLSGLASTEYLPAIVLFDWVQEGGAGINTVPHMGLLRELCDAGLIGFYFCTIFVMASGRALRGLCNSKNSDAACWQIARPVFWVATAIYLIQTSPLSAAPSVFFAIGLAATWIAPATATAAQHVKSGAMAPSDTRLGSPATT